MGLGAVNAAPCVHGRRSARGAVNKRPQAAARANHRRHSAPLRAPHRVGAIHYATRSALEPPAAHAGRCGARAVANGRVYKPQVFGQIFYIERPCLGVHQGRRALRTDAGRCVRAPGVTAGSSGRRGACWQYAVCKALRFRLED